MVRGYPVGAAGYMDGRWRLLTVLANLALLAFWANCALAQTPYIPPTRVPQSEEPPLANPKEAPSTPLPRVPNSGMPYPGQQNPAMAPFPRPVAPTRPSNDPPPPVVSVHVRAPASVALGKDIEYKLVVENTSSAPAHHVLVSNAVPKNTTFVSADPEPEDKAAPMLRWQLGSMAAGARKEIKLVLRPSGDGDVNNVARVQFEHGEQVTTKLQRPQLRVQHYGPTHTHENDAMNIRLVVENTGVVEVKNILVTEQLDDGLDHEGNNTGSQRERPWKIDSLQAGKKQEFTYTIFAKKKGSFSGRVLVKADAMAEVKSSWTVVVGSALLDVSMTGPEKSYLSQPTSYQISVRNTGEIPLNNVAVKFHLPQSITVVRATQGAEKFKSELQWIVASLPAGASKLFTISVSTTTPGKLELIAEALGKGATGRANVGTDFQGAVALRMRIDSSNNPVAVGEKVTYTVTIENTGNVEAKNVNLRVSYPLLLLSPDHSNPTPNSQNNDLTFASLTVKPKDAQRILITMKAAGDGNAVFHAELTSPEHLTSGPLVVEESTTITR
jgi:uncharacterized repeat protein (TIGR01451 family)